MKRAEEGAGPPFKLVLARVEHTPTRRQVFDPNDVAHFESLVDAVRAARSPVASGWLPHIESHGVVFLPHHVEVLLAELDKNAAPTEGPRSSGDIRLED